MNLAPPAPDARPATLDHDVLLRLRELDPDGSLGVVMRVLDTYQKSLQRMLAQLQAERERGDVAALGLLAHTMKSSSASVGALALAQACQKVEQRVRSGTPGDLEADIGLLRTEANAALAAVAHILRT